LLLKKKKRKEYICISDAKMLTVTIQSREGQQISVKGQRKAEG
jgi:hypothetical protein